MKFIRYSLWSVKYYPEEISKSFRVAFALYFSDPFDDLLRIFWTRFLFRCLIFFISSNHIDKRISLHQKYNWIWCTDHHRHHFTHHIFLIFEIFRFMTKKFYDIYTVMFISRKKIFNITTVFKTFALLQIYLIQ